eukprot:CAMPEP_0172449306 /NCGR_PEP_ID=MMETSP1065-20121228/8058_1 /TAXON_ID=265537 /ORGANISM="Amphiprora paludosa, Strain CCMP125" /LENGTH=33 /DNA_ID= /DNA_START= /DNA_END= /DNA_ORIENTATION=
MARPRQRPPIIGNNDDEEDEQVRQLEASARALA